MLAGCCQSVDTTRGEPASSIRDSVAKWCVRVENHQNFAAAGTAQVCCAGNPAAGAGREKVRLAERYVA
jgi:hypothetical protein